jgi:hypothetical protein
MLEFFSGTRGLNSINQAKILVINLTIISISSGLLSAVRIVNATNASLDIICRLFL